MTLLNTIKKSYVVRGTKLQLRHAARHFPNYYQRGNFNQLCSVVGLMLLAALVLFVGNGHHAGFHTLNQFTPYFLADFWQMITFLGDTLASLCLMLFFARRNPTMLWIILIAALYGILFSHGMKAYFDAPRPAGVLNHEQFNLLGQAFSRNSFPSGHSLTIFVPVTTIYYFSNLTSTKIQLILFGSLVALSRVMVGAHWPIDVLVGSALGILVTLAAIATARRFKWGFSQACHYFVLSLLLIATTLLFNHDGGYSGAGLFAKVLGTAALAFWISDYLLRPYALYRWRLQRAN